jgi:hypothetical protein
MAGFASVLTVSCKVGDLGNEQGPGRVMRVIGETIMAQPKRRFTLAELAKLAYPDKPASHAQLVAVGRAVRKLEATQEVPRRTKPTSGSTSRGSACAHHQPVDIWGHDKIGATAYAKLDET